MSAISLPGLGDGPPPQEFTPSLADLTRWAAAADDPTEFHLDAADAASHGFAGPVVHGPYLSARVAGMLTAWLGPGTALRSLDCRYRRPAIAGDALRCTAVVTSTEPAPEAGVLITLEITVEDSGGGAVLTGEASAAAT